MDFDDLIIYARQIAGGPSTSGLNEAQMRAIAVNIAFIVFTVVIMGMRMWARLVITKAVGTDDIIMVFGTLVTIGLSISIMTAVCHGIGKIRADIPLESWEPMLLAFWASRLLYAAAMALVKVGLLSFYVRLDNRPMMRWTVYGLMVVVLGMGVAHFVVAILECTPPEVFWTSRGNIQVYMEKCMDQSTQQAFWDAAGVIVIITDVCLWVCPIPMIWNLQLPNRQKWIVSAVFAFGIVSIFAGCVRFYYVRQLANEPELYRQLADSLIWYALELYIAIFCGCSSALKVFFKRYFPALLGSSSPRSQYPLGSYGRNGTRTTNSHQLVSLSRKQTGNNTIISAGGRARRADDGMRGGSRNDSEEAIIPNKGGIRMKTEFQQEVTRASIESEDKTQGSGTKATSHARSFVR